MKLTQLFISKNQINSLYLEVYGIATDCFIKFGCPVVFDIITKYAIRYVKRPRAIRLANFGNMTIDGESTPQCCELDPILFPEIIQRACELASAVYKGDLQS